MSTLQVLSILSNNLGQYTIILMAFVTGGLPLFFRAIGVLDKPIAEGKDTNNWRIASSVLIFVGLFFAFIALIGNYLTLEQINKYLFNIKQTFSNTDLKPSVECVTYLVYSSFIFLLTGFALYQENKDEHANNGWNWVDVIFAGLFALLLNLRYWFGYA